MKFTPLTKKYSFSSDTLTKDFPSFMREPLRSWIWELFRYTDYIDRDDTYLTSVKYYITDSFRDELQLHFREVYPQYWDEFVTFILSDTERTADFLAFCLQNFSDARNAKQLEWILSQGGSGYDVIQTDKNAMGYTKGVYNLADRIDPMVKRQTENALNDNELIQESWSFCYSRNPDYEKVVSRCCDFLEKFLGDIYFPKDPKPQLKKFVHHFIQNPSVLHYKGDTIVNPKSNLTSLLEKASDIRGQHTGGLGRKPTKEEAEFVLHTTIYIWNLHKT